MRIFDENDVEITSPDLSLGHLVEEQRFVAHHPGVEAVAEGVSVLEPQAARLRHMAAESASAINFFILSSSLFGKRGMTTPCMVVFYCLFSNLAR